MIDRQISRILNGEIPDCRLREAFIHRALAKIAVGSAHLDSSTFMISHDDLAPQNIIIDSDNNISGYELFHAPFFSDCNNGDTNSTRIID